MNLTIQDYILGFATVITIISALREIRKGPSESEQRVTSSAVNVMDRVILRLEFVEKEVKNLQTEIDRLEDENSKLKAGISVLILQLRERGIKPQWTPYDNDKNDTPSKKRF